MISSAVSSFIHQEHSYVQQRPPLYLPPPPRHPLLIPELRDQITGDLTVQDYIRCLLVNRLWNKIFMPYIYHTIVIRQHSIEQAKVASFSNTVATSAAVSSVESSLQHHGQWVRHLDLRVNDPDIALRIIREYCPFMEIVKLNFGRLLEEQFEFLILGIRSPTILHRFEGVRDSTEVSDRQEQRRPSIGSEFSMTAASMEKNDDLVQREPKDRENSLNIMPQRHDPLSFITDHETPVVVPTSMIAPQVHTSAALDDDTKLLTPTTVDDTLCWHIPPGHNGFLSNTIRNLQLQVPGGSLYAVLLWLTRAGLDGRLQGLQSFRLSGQEISTVFGIPSSAIHDFLVAHPRLEQLALLSIQVEPALSETSWESLEGSEGSEMLQVMIDSGSTPTPANATSISASDSRVSRDSDIENNTELEIDEGAMAMAAVAAALTAAVPGNPTQPALYKGTHYKIHNRDYFADLIAAGQPTLEKLKSTDPQGNQSKVIDLHIFQDGQLGPLLSRLPHLLRLTTEFFERSRTSPDLLLPIQRSCRSLVSFTYLGKPSCPFADRYPRNNQSSSEPFFHHWELFIQELIHLKELILLNANLRDEDLRTLVRYGHDRLRILRMKGETRATWHGARIVLENCSQSEECTLTCYGSIDDLFAVGGDPVFLSHQPTSGTMASTERDQIELGEGRENHSRQQSDPTPSPTITRQDPSEWPSKDTLHSLCLSGIVLYNDDANQRLFARLKSLRRLRGLTIVGRGMTLETLFGKDLRDLALENERLYQEFETKQLEKKSRGQSSSISNGCGSADTHKVTIDNMKNDYSYILLRKECLYPELETLDIPRLHQKLTSKDVVQLMKELPKLRWMDCGGAYELETLVWLQTRRRDLLKTFSR
ncbi:hypothetical protein FBU30_008817 [Linnemannia zychae]|nr:hypothetical protein FBU30_008817 [Linnemannia zychae]